MPTPRSGKRKSETPINTSSAKKQRAPTFPNKMTTHPFSGTSTFPSAIGRYRVCGCYKLGNQTHLLFKQVSSKDCGSGSALMLLSSFSKAKQEPLNIEKLIGWLGDPLCNLSTMESGINGAFQKNSSYRAQALRIPLKDPLEFIQQELKRSKLPVIVSITHPEIEGHWVVIDAITDSEAFIRDPYTGSAYKIPLNVMEGYLQAGEVEESLLSIRPK